MVEKLPSKETNFSEWYTEVIVRAQMADYAPIQGCIVFMPNSYSIWEKIQDFVNDEIRKTGHKNAYFPMFIPERFLKKESEHFEGFVPEVAWVTHGGNSELGERLAIRPTSETIIYSMYKDWIQSYRDLPMLLNQWCSVVRWETKAVKPFLRTREFLWQEGHTVHATKEDAAEEVKQQLELYKRVAEELLAIPVMAGVKTEKEKFAGALYTTTIEALMPDGKALQMGTSHHLGDHFSKVFDITFLDENEKKARVWQTSWGISTRMIGAMIMVHGDDKGLVIPPKAAATQIVIVPITYDDDKEGVLKKAKEIEKDLKKKFSVHLDDREIYKPGWKFNEWEMRGIPIRVEIGPKDLEKKQVVLARRDTGEKKTVKMVDVEKEILKLVEDIQDNLFEKAKKYLAANTIKLIKYDEFQKVFDGKNNPKLIKTCHCGDSKCEEEIADETGATVRLIPFEEEKEKTFCKCVKCGKDATLVAYFGRAY
ncbi:proline--tRNA ligase [Candidatus Undinarchaeota archaeon]